MNRSDLEGFHEVLSQAGIRRAYVVRDGDGLVASHAGHLADLVRAIRHQPAFADHEAVFLCRYDDVRTVFFAFVHDTRRGLSQGGVRAMAYDSVEAVLFDGLRLSQGMTRKCALAGVRWGGGKGVIPLTPTARRRFAEPDGEKARQQMLKAYGAFVASLGGVYYTAEDIGTSAKDMAEVLSACRFVTCVPREAGGSGNPSPHTARGVFCAIQAAHLVRRGTDSLAGVHVAVQGVGQVGSTLVDLLIQARAKVTIADVSEVAVATILARHPGVVVVSPEAIYDVEAEVFVPCAVGGTLDARTIPRLRCEVVCGGANNILFDPSADAARLHARGILFVPDFVSNRMGIVNCCDEAFGYLESEVRRVADETYHATLNILRLSGDRGQTPLQTACDLADVAAAVPHPLHPGRGHALIQQIRTSGWHEANP